MKEFSTFDTACMARAVQLARRGWYTTRPNPRVGAVIARQGQVLGEGWHQRAGEPHAEVMALAAAGEQARGATAYVSLEPCNHQGRTGPCTRALIDAGIAELVYGMADPHPKAAGGIAQLQAAGVKVRGPLLGAEARALNPGFIKRCETGLPWVTVKLAMSLDGRTAMASGESHWITGPAARRDVQRLRMASGAIVTGIGTLLQDDPALTVRAGELDLPEAEAPTAEAIAALQPLRVLVDSQLRLQPDAKLLQQSGGSVLVATLQADQTLPQVEVVCLPAKEAQVDLEALLRLLAGRECNDVLVEAGAELAGAFLRAGLVDELVVYMAPRLLGSLGRPLLDLPLHKMAESVPLNVVDIRAIGDDWRITAMPSYEVLDP